MADKEFNLSEKINEKGQIWMIDIREFIKWCVTHSHISDEVQVIAISKLKEGAGEKLI